MNENLLFWIGENDQPVISDRSSDLVMDSVIHYYNSETPKLSYSFKELFLDNGAFTSVVNGIELDREKVIAVQESLWPNRTISLDFPSRPGMSISEIRKNWERTKENIVYWQESTKLRKRLVAPLHAWSKTSLRENVAWLQRHADTDLLAVGSLVNLTRFYGFFGDRQPRRELIDLLALSIETVKSQSDFKVHIMGFGSSPLMLHLAYYLGADSTDSAGYRRKAAYGKILLPGTGERYVGNSSARFGLTNYSEKDLHKLKSCDCPVCRINQDLLWLDWKARGIHNDYVMKNEVEEAKDYVSKGRGEYEAFLDKTFESSSLHYLWEYTKQRMSYPRISEMMSRK
jgi:7-cyano-7-deazaguanine tRNA-ribosyltransferase